MAVTPALEAAAITTAAVFENALASQDFRAGNRTNVAAVSPGSTLNGWPTAITLAASSITSVRYEPLGTGLKVN
jgi:hypothetical protein